jgi:hypothetical protein
VAEAPEHTVLEAVMAQPIQVVVAVVEIVEVVKT